MQRFAFAFGLLHFAFFCFVSTAEARSFVVLVHPANPASAFDKEALEDIFLGKNLFWPSGNRIRPALLEYEDVASKDFIKEVLGFEVSQFSDFWRRKLFSGRGVPPKTFQHSEELLNFTELNEAVIAVVPASLSLNKRAIKKIELSF